MDKMHFLQRGERIEPLLYFLPLNVEVAWVFDMGYGII